MKPITINWQGAQITVRRPTIRDMFTHDRVLVDLPQDTDPTMAFYFAHACSCCEVEGLDWQAPTSSEDTARAFEAWLALDAGLGEQWVSAILKQTRSQNKADRAAPETLSDTEKKDTGKTA